MIGRLIVGAVAWLIALLVLATALQWPARARLRLRDHPPTSALARSLNGPVVDPSARRWWAVTTATASNQFMLVDVVVVRVDEAVAIAKQIIEPVRGQYDEILVYVRRASAAGGPATRRVQWTRRGGYIEMQLHAEP